MNWKKKIIMEQISDFTKRLGLGKVAYLELTSKESSLGLAGKKIEITFSDNPFKYRSQTLVLFLKREDNITEYLEFTLIEGITLQLSKHVRTYSRRMYFQAGYWYRWKFNNIRIGF